MFPGVQLAASISIGSGNGMASNKWQTIAWTHADHDIMPTNGTKPQNNLWTATHVFNMTKFPYHLFVSLYCIFGMPLSSAIF